MFKIATDEILGNGTVVFFKNPITDDLKCAVDGIDNDLYVSWYGIREGVVGKPTCLNHMDLWLNNAFQHNELEGLAAFKEESDDAWDYKEKEILQKYAVWQKAAVFGRVSSDGAVLQFINPTGDTEKSKDIIKQLLNKGLIEESTHLFINNSDLGLVGKFLLVDAQCALFASSKPEVGEKPMVVSKLLIEAASHDQELLGLIEEYKNLKAAEATMPEEDKALNEQQMNNLRSQAFEWIYEDYEPLIRQMIRPIVSTFPLGEDRGNPNAKSDYFIVPVMSELVNKLFDVYDPSQGKVSTFVGNTAKMAAYNALRQEQRKNKKFTTIAPAGESDIEGGGGDDKAGDFISNVDEDYRSVTTEPKSTNPLKNVMQPEHTQSVMEKLKSTLKPNEFEILQKYYGEGKTFDQIGQEKGVSRQAVEQLLKSIVSRVKGLFNEHQLGKVDLAVKKVTLSLPS